MSRTLYLFSTTPHRDAVHVNSLDITFFTPKVNFGAYDYFIITSKQSIEGLKNYPILTLLPALCVSKKTAMAYEKIDGKILDTGNGYGKSLIEKVAQYPKEKRWLYLRAEIVASDFISTCRDDGHDIDELVLYKSECSKNFSHVEIKQDAVLIFTSPSSVRCFLEHQVFYNEQKVVVIGRTTAQALPKDIVYSECEKSCIDNCIEMALKL